MTAKLFDDHMYRVEQRFEDRKDSGLLTLMMSGLDGSGAVHFVLTWEAFGGHVPPGGSEIYWFDQSVPIHLF